MKWEVLRKILAAKQAATEETPFGPETKIFKVGGRIFAAVGWMHSPVHVALKCDPDEVPFLRSTHPAITGAPYFNKRHWNQVKLDGTVPEELVIELIDESYELVKAKLPRYVRAEIDDPLPNNRRR